MSRFSVLWLSVAFFSPVTMLSAEKAADKEIVVTGASLADTERTLKSCLAGNCSPDADVRAAIAHAENQFVAGEYRAAKSTLKKAIGRNGKYRNQFPMELSYLYRASGRIAEHLGETDEYRLRLLDMRDTLRSNFPADDARVLSAQLEIADSRVKLGYPDNALDIYADVEKAALAVGQNQIATLAKLRANLLIYAIGENERYQPDMKRARAALTEMVKRPLPGSDDFSLVAEVALARIDRREGRGDSTDAIMRRVLSRGVDRPILLSADAIDMPRSAYGERTNSGQSLLLNVGPRRIEGESMPAPQNVLTQIPRNFEDRWMDVGFWVTADGRVNDVEILRTEGSGDWTKLVINSIQSRQYAPIRDKDGATHPGFYMIERYTYTARYMEDITGSRIPRRSTQPRIERLDLTPENFDQPFANMPKTNRQTAS